jgi:hypothetical protein
VGNFREEPDCRGGKKTDDRRRMTDDRRGKTEGYKTLIFDFLSSVLPLFK